MEYSAVMTETFVDNTTLSLPSYDAGFCIKIINLDRPSKFIIHRIITHIAVRDNITVCSFVLELE
jgi:hypothetical protein